MVLRGGPFVVKLIGSGMTIAILAVREIFRGRGRVVAQDWRGEILLPGFFPFAHAHAGGIENNASGTHGHPRGDGRVSIHASPTAIYKAKFSVQYLQNRDIRVLADGER